MTTFLLVLKIIGLVLGGILGLAILMCLLVLLCPEVYKLKVKGKNADMTAVACAHWLLGIACFKAIYEDNNLTYYARIFGIKILSSDKEETDNAKEAPLEASRAPAKTKAEARPGAKSVKAETGPAAKRAKRETGERPEGEKKTFAEKVSEVLEKIKAVWEKIKTVKYILGASVTHRAWAVVKKEMLEILKIMLPKKMLGRLEFGTGDPATTAEAYGISNAIVCAIDDRLVLVPNMEEKLANADFSIKGRIFNAHVLICVLRMIRNKDVGRVISYIRRNL